MRRAGRAVDAPELAQLGPFGVGVRTIELVHAAQPDVLAFDPATGTAPKRDRRLTVDLWYPADVAAGRLARDVRGQPHGRAAGAARRAFTRPGIAVRDAKRAQPAASRSSSSRTATTTNPCCSAGSPRTSPRRATWSRPSAIATRRSRSARGFPSPCCAARSTSPSSRKSLQGALAEANGVDASRVALVGYSMGGYGVLTAAGGELDPASPAAGLVPGGLMKAYARGGDAARRGARPRREGGRGHRAGRRIAQRLGRRRPARRSPRRSCSSRAIATARSTTSPARARSSMRRRTATATC